MANQPSILKALDLADYNRLKDEADKSLMGWASAVRQIKERELWRFEFDTWTEFCNVVLKRSDSYVRLLLQGEQLAKADQLLVDTGQKKVDDSKILKAKTVKEIRQAVKQTVSAGHGKDSTPLTDKNDSSPEPIAPRDRLGVIIPPELVALWDRGDEAKELIHQLQAVKRVLDKVQADGKDLLWAEVKAQAASLDVGNAIRQIKNAVPYAVCPYCQGVLTKTCSFCYHRGLVSQWRLDAVPKDLMEMQMKKGQQ